MPQQPPNPLDDCERPSCDGVKSMFQKAMAAAASSETQSTVECPPNSSVLGHGSWNLLHSMAAWYPDHPSPQDQRTMTHFFEAIARFYPCTYCAQDFAQNFQETPIRTESRTELCQWLCEQHNMVNKKLGKKTFSCDMKTLDERWRKSSNPSCS